MRAELVLVEQRNFRFYLSAVTLSAFNTHDDIDDDDDEAFVDAFVELLRFATHDNDDDAVLCCCCRCYCCCCCFRFILFAVSN